MDIVLLQATSSFFYERNQIVKQVHERYFLPGRPRNKEEKLLKVF